MRGVASSTALPQVVDATSRLAVPAHAAWAWHARPGALERLLAPWQGVNIERPGAVADGERVELRLGAGRLFPRFVAEHRNVKPGESFEDVQIKGPFREWRHTHRFEPLAGDACLYRDRIEYRLPRGSGWLGGTVRSQVERTLAYRHRTVAADLALHARYAERPRLRVAISGASGLIGRALAALLSTGGHDVLRLVRREPREPSEIAWRPEDGTIDRSRLEGLDALVHLAGENVAAGRWTEARRRSIRSSRVEATERLVASLGTLERPPRTFLCASATGYYGPAGADGSTEDAPPGSGFLAGVCRDWEAAARQARDFDARVLSLRFGVVLSAAGGALARMLPVFRAGLGGPLGSGRQGFPWISLDDAISAVLFLLYDDGLTGPVNVVAPAVTSSRELARALGRALRRPSLMPVPAPVLLLVFGQMAREALLAGASVRPARLEAAGFPFRHPRLEVALDHLLGLRSAAGSAMRR